MSNTEHPYAHILRAIADGDTVQFRGVDGIWLDETAKVLLEEIATGLAGPDCFRVKPRTIIINGIEVPEPLRVAPAHGTPYFVPVPHSEGLVIEFDNWVEDGNDRRLLLRGFVHLTKEAAIAHAKALVSFTEIKE